MTDESITFELGRHASDVIGLIERNPCQNNITWLNLDWLFNAAVRYSDNIPSGEAVMAFIQEATEPQDKVKMTVLIKTPRFKQGLQILVNEEDHALLFQRIAF